jgi:hypothetical protein
MTGEIAPVALRIGKLIRLMASDKDGEALGAVYALRRTLLQDHAHELDPKHRQFIDDMASRTVWHEPTDKQQKYLKSLYLKLGGLRGAA